VFQECLKERHNSHFSIEQMRKCLKKRKEKQQLFGLECE
jgi:hypothetical protein